MDGKIDGFEFLSYYPLKQGLKQLVSFQEYKMETKFLSYYPLKQGLKLACMVRRHTEAENFYPTIH